MSSNDGDYSFFMHTVEGTIGNNIPPSPSTRIALSGTTLGTHAKRARLSIESDTGNTMYGSTLKSLAVVDELKIQNEQLSEQLAECKVESELSEERLLKQIVYLEEQNTRLKKEAEARQEKYYEEKRKYQSDMRKADVTIKRLEQNELDRTLNASSFLGSDGTNRSVQSSSEAASHIQEKINRLEELVSKVSAESKQNLTEKINMESELFKAVQEIKTIKATDVGRREDGQDAKELRIKVVELESLLMKRSREIQTYEGKLKNQSLLEEEVASQRQKLSLATKSIKDYKTMEAEYRNLLNEKRSWSELFGGIIQEVLTTTASSRAEVTPAKVLEVLTALQHRHAVSMKVQGEYEVTIQDLRRKMLQYEQRISSEESAKSDIIQKCDKLESELRASAQRARLFESEITSLRSLLQTFDVEFSIGCGKDRQTSKLLALKDEVIASIRLELDKSRDQSKELIANIQRIECVAKNSAAGKQQSATQAPLVGIASIDNKVPPDGFCGDAIEHLKNVASTAESALLRTKGDLRALQDYCGVDYIPGDVQIVHSLENPFSIAMRDRRKLLGAGVVGGGYQADSLNVKDRGSEVIVSSVPVEELKRLRSENKELKNSIALLRQGGCTTCITASSDNSSSSAICSSGSISENATNTSLVAPAPQPVLPMSTTDSAKLNQRLKEMFKERITAFREAVYLLTGYKIDLYAADTGGNSFPRLRLRSMYAEKPDDSLLFQWKGDNLELLDTEFASKLDSKLFAYLTTCNSVPAFLSNVTIDLFESQTFMG